jgi:hypothetical protein
VKVGIIDIEFDQDLFVLLALGVPLEPACRPYSHFSTARACEECPDLSGVDTEAATCTEELPSICSTSPVSEECRDKEGARLIDGEPLETERDSKKLFWDLLLMCSVFRSGTHY